MCAWGENAYSRKYSPFIWFYAANYIADIKQSYTISQVNFELKSSSSHKSSLSQLKFFPSLKNNIVRQYAIILATKKWKQEMETWSFNEFFYFSLQLKELVSSGLISLHTKNSCILNCCWGLLNLSPPYRIVTKFTKCFKGCYCPSYRIVAGFSKCFKGCYCPLRHIKDLVETITKALTRKIFNLLTFNFFFMHTTQSILYILYSTHYYVIILKHGSLTWLPLFDSKFTFSALD